MADVIDRAIFTHNVHTAQIRAELLRPAQLVTFYLMASYLYYHHDMQLMSDSEYDRVCVRLNKEWDSITHPHKKYIDREALGATTGYHMRELDYPLMARGAAIRLANERGIRP
jgi:hypothetical protein